jgi:hypothetical protein
VLARHDTRVALVPLEAAAADIDTLADYERLSAG